MTSCEYKKTEIEIRNIVQEMRNGPQSLYQLAIKCTRLLNDADNYARAIEINTKAVVHHLNGFLQDFAVDAETLVELLVHFPKQEQWNKPLLQLLEDAETARDAEKVKANENTIRVRRSATIQELDDLRRQLQEKELELEKLRSVTKDVVAVDDSLATENKRLASENKTLRRQLADALATIRQLEKRREPAMV